MKNTTARAWKSTVSPRKAKEWKSFVAENGMTWINVLSGRDRVYRDYGIEFIPTVFLIDCKTGDILVRDSHPDLDGILSDLLQYAADAATAYRSGTTDRPSRSARDARPQ